MGLSYLPGPDVLALATRQQGWLLPLSGAVGTALSGSLAKLLTEGDKPALVARRVTDTTRALGSRLAISRKDFDWFLDCFVGDAAQLGAVAGVPVPDGATMTPLQDALDCAVTFPQLRVGAPSFYNAVAWPLVCHTARSQPDEINPKTWRRWVVTYEHLLLRVLAHYTRDPYLLRILGTDGNPWEALSQALRRSSAGTQAMFLWMACGSDTECFSRRFPRLLPDLPENPEYLQAASVDKLLPALRLGLIDKKSQYERERPRTLYGRIGPSALSPAARLAWALFGGIQDLIDVAVVSFANLGSRHHWALCRGGDYHGWTGAAIAGWIPPEMPEDEWLSQLRKVAPLRNPLALPLAAVVSYSR